MNRNHEVDFRNGVAAQFVMLLLGGAGGLLTGVVAASWVQMLVGAVASSAMAAVLRGIYVRHSAEVGLMGLPEPVHASFQSDPTGAAARFAAQGQLLVVFGFSFIAGVFGAAAGPGSGAKVAVAAVSGATAVFLLVRYWLWFRKPAGDDRALGGEGGGGR